MTAIEHASRIPHHALRPTEKQEATASKGMVTSNHPLASLAGTEMLVLRAEAALRNNDIPGAIGLLNQARAVTVLMGRTVGSLPALSVPATLAEAWSILHYERGATTWLENRRFWDERRWFAETGPAHFDFLNGRDKCIPISDEERRANHNVPPAAP